MEWNIEENFSMDWKVFSMEWKWNGRKLPVWNMEKSSSIPCHAQLVKMNRQNGERRKRSGYLLEKADP